MFGIGMNEMLIIGIIALVVIGPKRFPDMARTMGQMMAKFKRATNDLRDAVNDEISSHEELKELKAIKSEFEDDIWSVQQSARETMKSASADAESAFSEMNPDYPPDGPFSGIPTSGEPAPEADAQQTPNDSDEPFSRGANGDDAESSASGVAPEGTEGAISEDAIQDGADGAPAKNEVEDDSSPKKGRGSASRES